MFKRIKNTKVRIFVEGVVLGLALVALALALNAWDATAGEIAFECFTIGDKMFCTPVDIGWTV